MTCTCNKVAQSVSMTSSQSRQNVTDVTLCVADVILKISQADGESYFRPIIGDLPGEYHSVMMNFIRLIQGCWAEDPALRPTSRRVLRILKRLNPFQ